jgi:hypothetical protein
MKALDGMQVIRRALLTRNRLRRAVDLMPQEKDPSKLIGYETVGTQNWSGRFGKAK